jgi:ankyrin repeat protein
MFYEIKLAQDKYLDLIQKNSRLPALKMDPKKLNGLLLALSKASKDKLSENNYFAQAILAVWMHCNSIGMDYLFYQSYQDLLKFKKNQKVEPSKRLLWFCAALTDIIWSNIKFVLKNNSKKHQDLAAWENMLLALKEAVPCKYQNNERYLVAGDNNCNLRLIKQEFSDFLSKVVSSLGSDILDKIYILISINNKASEGFGFNDFISIRKISENSKDTKLVNNEILKDLQKQNMFICFSPLFKAGAVIVSEKDLIEIIVDLVFASKKSPKKPDEKSDESLDVNFSLVTQKRYENLLADFSWPVGIGEELKLNIVKDIGKDKELNINSENKMGSDKKEVPNLNLVDKDANNLEIKAEDIEQIDINLLLEKLHNCIENGLVYELSELLKSQILKKDLQKINVSDGILIKAINKGVVDVVHLLVASGCNPNASDKSGVNAYDHALMNNKLDMFNVLDGKYKPADNWLEPPKAKVSDEVQLDSFADELGSLDLGFNSDLSEEIEVRPEWVSLRKAIALGKTSRVAILLSKHPDLIDYVDPKDNLMMHWVAAMSGKDEVIEYFLEKMSSEQIKSLDDNKNGLLHYALMASSPIIGTRRDTKIPIQNIKSCVSEILDKYPDFALGENNQKITPFVLAMFLENLELLEILLQKGAFVSSYSFVNNPELLHIAVVNKKVNLVKFFIENRSNPNLKNVDGNTPLHLAVNVRGKILRSEIINLLCEAGAKVDLKNNQNKSALDIATHKSDLELIDILEKLKKANNNLGSNNNSKKKIWMESVSIVKSWLLKFRSKAIS